MIKICSQTNVAEVDNSAQTCEKLISTDCIIHEAAIAYLNLPENSSTTDVIAAFLTSLTDARSRLAVLESKPPKLINDEVGTTYTLVATDAENIITFENAAPVALTVPVEADLNFAIGTEIDLINKGAGDVTVGGAGITFLQESGLIISQGASRTLVKVAADTWVLKN